MDYLIGELIQVLESLQNKEGVDFWDAALWLFGLFIAPWLLIWRITRWNAKKRYQSTILQGDELRASLEASNELVREQKKQIEAVSAKWTTAEAKLPDAYLARMKAHKQQNNWSFEPAESHEFITAQAPALHLAFSTLARKAVEDSIEDGPAAIENAHMFASAAVAVDPQDRLSRMLVDELAQGWDGIAGDIKIPDAVNLAAHMQKEERIAHYVTLIEAHVDAAYKAGRYNIMESYARYGERMAVRFLGETSRRTLWFGVLVANAIRLTGRVEHALKKFSDIIPSVEKSAGVSGEETLHAKYLKAYCLETSGRSKEALEILTDNENSVIPLREKINGPKHHATLMSQYLAACCLNSTGRAAEALDILLRQDGGLIALQKNLKGIEDRSTLTSQYLAACCLINLGFDSKALDILTREHDGLIALREKIHGLEHPETLTNKALAAECLRKVGNTVDALDILTRNDDGIIQLTEKVMGPEHPHTLTTRSLAAHCYIDLAQPEQAEKIHRGVLKALLAKNLTKEHPLVQRAREVEALLAGTSEKAAQTQL